ncbi:unnamed protein product [Spirodela intermedia]|uniref:Uncharacterized protein n=1 Tax=Spirodela intermedia TaxID=51605 RepID=A0A7I8JJT0_SPIIN|nr:unnamed protein product [Spirodela intermedia]CAA6670330.1 unnamed protein product [Spirodela intermedia]
MEPRKNTQRRPQKILILFFYWNIFIYQLVILFSLHFFLILRS